MSWQGKAVIAVDHKGASKRLTLGERLGGGMEGTAYGVAQPADMSGLAVKIFKDGKQARKIEKVRAMLQMDPEPHVQKRRIAWPINIVHFDGAAIGYGMIRVPRTQLLAASEPQLRRELRTNLDFFSLHWLAENLAKTISSLHVSTHVVADLKDTNATFDPKTLEVFLIDTDSFRIKAHESNPVFQADATTPDWSPPEYRASDQPGISHDLFSLAVFYHLLMFSVHPFAGSSKGRDGEDSTVSAIKAGHWMYRDHPAPNKHDPPFSVIAPGLQVLFRRAFVDAHHAPHLRPTAKEWEEAFHEARYDLRWCDTHPLHVFDGRSKSCPWCRLKPERWVTNHQPRSMTKDIARVELRTLTEGAALSEENLKRAERRLAANPAFQRDLPEVRERIELYKRSQAELHLAIKTLREAEHDDIKLIDAAKQFSKNAELGRTARMTFGLGGLLDRAAELEACLGRLTAAVAAAGPDPGGRFFLDGEKSLLDAFQHDAAILDRSDGLLLRFAPRRVAARERLEAARVLSSALSGGGQPAPPIEHLRNLLNSHGDRLSEIADEDINGGTGKVRLARNIVALSDDVDRPATACTDQQIVAFWDRHIGPHASMALQLLDAKPAPGKMSLRAAVAEARQSREAISKFEDLLKSSAQAPGNIQDQDRAILAADPTALVSARERVVFGATWSGQILAGARRRADLTERIEQLALDPAPDATDAAILAAWQGTEERDMLGLSDSARNRIRSAEARMARFERIRAVANEQPPADERLIAALADISPEGDLLGLELLPGQTLRARVELAAQRIGLRDVLAAEIAKAAGTEPGFESEEKIASAWDAAASARQQAASLFAPFAIRAEKASLRVSCYRELAAALKDQHGDRASRVWQQHRKDLSDFSPVAALQPEVELLLSRYRNFRHLLACAAKRPEDEELIALSGQMTEALRLKDADEAFASLDNRSVAQAIAAAHLRQSLRKRLDGLAGLALDPGRLRAELAVIADQLPSHHDLNRLDSEFAPQLIEAAAAAGLADSLQKAIADHDLEAFRQLWNETWHPLLPRTSELAPSAREMVAAVAGSSVVREAAIVRLGDDRVRLSWRWPAANRPDPVAGHASGSEVLTLAINDRRSPDKLDDAQHIVELYRLHDEDTGTVEMTFGGDRMAAALFPGHLVGGQPIHASRPTLVTEPRRRLTYRFQAATFREPDDWLLIRSRHGLLTPPLRIVHPQSGRTISIIDGQPLRAGMEHALNLSQLRAYSGHSAPWWGRIRRFMSDELFCYALELDDPSDQDWVEIVHPVATAERQLSFVWQEPIAGPEAVAS